MSCCSWICVISSVCNQSVIVWERIKSHLKGIWHLESLDLVKLHQKIMEMKMAKLDFIVAKAVEDIF